MVKLDKRRVGMIKIWGLQSRLLKMCKSPEIEDSCANCCWSPDRSSRIRWRLCRQAYSTTDLPPSKMFDKYWILVPWTFFGLI